MDVWWRAGCWMEQVPAAVSVASHEPVALRSPEPPPRYTDSNLHTELRHTPTHEAGPWDSFASNSMLKGSKDNGLLYIYLDFDSFSMLLAIFKVIFFWGGGSEEFIF